jgi:quinol-cytochrome oxidoreductase complex cytochrome b subunit
VIAVIVGAAFALLPLFDRKPERRLRHRPAAAGFGVLFFLGFVVLWIAGRAMSGSREGAAAHPGVEAPGVEQAAPGPEGTPTAGDAP